MNNTANRSTVFKNSFRDHWVFSIKGVSDDKDMPEQGTFNQHGETSIHGTDGVIGIATIHRHTTAHCSLLHRVTHHMQMTHSSLLHRVTHVYTPQPGPLGKHDRYRLYHTTPTANLFDSTAASWNPSDPKPCKWCREQNRQWLLSMLNRGVDTCDWAGGGQCTLPKLRHNQAAPYFVLILA